MSWKTTLSQSHLDAISESYVNERGHILIFAEPSWITPIEYTMKTKHSNYYVFSKYNPWKDNIINYFNGTSTTSSNKEA